MLIDEKDGDASRLSPAEWEKVCSRGSGVGADGVLFFSRNPYKMHYINSDGHEADMCGNGLRAICDYILQNESNVSWPIEVQTKNHLYRADLKNKSIWIEMADLSEQGAYAIDSLFQAKGSYYINTGVPHAVFCVEDVDGIDLNLIAPAIRNWNGFPEGANVDIFSVEPQGHLKMRVFERGVEGETLSSGTGTTAVALAYRELYQVQDEVKIQTRGGLMQVRFEKDIPWLSGPVTAVYQGQLSETFLKAL